MRAAIAAVAFITLALVPRSASSGPLEVWGSDQLGLHAAPPGDFVSLAAGGALQTLALRPDGTLYLSGPDSTDTRPIPAIPSEFEGRSFNAVGMGRSHALAIRPDGSIVTWGVYSARCGPDPANCNAPTTGQFVAVTGGGNHSVALDSLGHVVVWGIIPNGTPEPTGVEFVAIAARQSYTLALSADGNIYGWGVDMGIFTSAVDPWTPDGHGHFIAPRDPSNPYTAIAAGLGPAPFGLIVALRADGSVRVWHPGGLLPAAPTDFVFTQVAAGLRYAVGLDQAGRLHVWGDAKFTAVPPGIYSAVAAATGHMSAIAVACTMPASNDSSTSWNKFNIPMGTSPVVWVHAQFKPIGVPATAVSTVRFTGVSFILNGIPYSIADGLVIFDPAAPPVSTTMYDADKARWSTTVNPSFISDENFFAGTAIPADASISGGGKATIRFTTRTDDPSLSFSWKWSAAAYTYWPTDWNAALIQPYHGNGPTGSQHADTPDNRDVQKSLIQGPRGGGGSNFTGSWSGTFSVAACP